MRINKTIYRSLFLLLSIPLLWTNSSFAQLKISPQITLKQEFNNNVNLSSGQIDTIKEDFVTHIMPVIAIKQLYKMHTFYVDLNGNYRRGFQSDLSNLNMNFSGGLNLIFNSGLSLYVKNNYLSASFDQALYDEVGIYTRNSNTLSAGLAYTYSPVNRLMFESAYQNKLDNFDNEGSEVKRRIDYVQGRLSIPVIRSLLCYGDYRIEKQDAPERRSRNYLDNRLVGGLKWKGTARITLYLEGGYGQITYDLPEMQDFKNIVGKAGIGALFSEAISGQLMAGQDGYGNPVFDIHLGYQYSERTSLSLLARRETKSSFSTLHQSGIIEYTWGQLQLIKHMFQKFVLVMNGSYQMQDSRADVNEDIKINHKLWVGYLSFSYHIQDWINVGINGQYATRISYVDIYDYNNSRLGIFIRLKK